MNTNENTKLIYMIEESKNTIENLHNLLENYDKILSPTLERKSFFKFLSNYYSDLLHIIKQIHKEVQDNPEDPEIFWMYIHKEHLRLYLAKTVEFYIMTLFPSTEMNTFFTELWDIYQELTKHDHDVYGLVFSDSDDKNLEVA